MKKYSLLLDTSFKKLSIGIAEGDKIFSKYDKDCWKQQSEKTIPEIEKILVKNKIGYKDLKEIIVGIGPGSFTGVRIGITVAKILAFSLGINIYGVSSMFATIGEAQNGICVFDARAGRSYVCEIKKRKKVIKETIIKNDDVLKLIEKEKIDVYGDVSHLNINKKCDNKILEGMLFLKKQKNKPDDVASLDAIYLKQNDDYKKM